MLVAPGVPGRASKLVAVLSLLIAALSVVAAGGGLWWAESAAPVPFETARGQTVLLQGSGVYRYESVFVAAGFRGQDLVTVALAVPLLVLAAFRHRRRPSPRTGLILLAVQAYFLYVYATMALGAAYNDLFLLYVALFAASLYAFIVLFVQTRAALGGAARGLPRHGPAIYFLAAGLVTLVVWAGPLVAALVRSAPPPSLDHYTTTFTFGLDLAVITPAALMAAILVWRRDLLGHVIAFPLLGIIVLLAPCITLATVFQRAAGVTFSAGEMIGPVAGFVALGLLGLWIGSTILAALDAAPQSAGTAAGP